MTGPLDNVTVAITEHRREQEMKVLIERFGARVISCPLLEEVPVEHRSELRKFVRSIIENELDIMVFFTGVGVRFLSDEARSMGSLPAFVSALRNLMLVVRGPKPVSALRTLDLRPDLKPKNPTSEGLLDLLVPSLLYDRNVGVQLYGTPNPDFCSELDKRGAKVRTVQVYNYAETSDRTKVAAFIETLIYGNVDVVTFTSAPQVRSLFRVAEDKGFSEALTEALDRRLLIAAVGGVTRRALRERGLDAAIVPGEPKMGRLAKSIADYFKVRAG